LCRIFYQANRHPGRATWPSTCPVEAIRPRIVKEQYTLYDRMSVDASTCIKWIDGLVVSRFGD
jgi:hypothetical protein